MTFDSQRKCLMLTFAMSWHGTAYRFRGHVSSALRRVEAIGKVPTLGAASSHHQRSATAVVLLSTQLITRSSIVESTTLAHRIETVACD